MYGRTRAIALAVAGAAVMLPVAVTADNASTFRDAIPRYGGADEFDPEDEDYQYAIALLAVVPAVLAVFTLIACIFTVLCKCCSVCCKCCTKCCGDSSERTYTNKERWIPLGVMALLAAVAMGMSAAGIAESGKLSDTLLAEPKSENDTTTLSFKAFVPNNVLRVKAKIQRLREPTETVESTLSGIVDDVSDRFDLVIDDLNDGLDDLTTAMADFGNDYATLEVIGAPDGMNYSCVACGAIALALSRASGELDAGAAVTVQEMRDLFSDFNTEMKAELPSINADVADLLKQMDEMDENLDQARNTSDDIIEKLEEYDSLRNSVTVAVFSVPIFALALAFVGAILRSGICFKTNMWTYFLVCFVFWILFAVHLPVAVVLSDACEYVEEYEKDTVRAGADNYEDPNQQNYEIAVACLDSKNVVDALGYRDELDFSEVIDLPNFGNISEQFDLDGFDELQGVVDTLTASTQEAFLFSYQLRAEDVWMNFSSENPGVVSASVTNAVEFVASDPGGNAEYAATQATVSDAIDTFNVLQARLNTMGSDLLALNTVKDQTEVSVLNQVSNVTDINEILEPILNIVDTLIAEATCEEAAVAYKNAKTLVCDNISRHLTTIALSLFMVAFFGWFIIYTSNLNAKRWPNPAPITVGDEDDNYNGMPMKRIDSESRSAAYADDGAAYRGEDAMEAQAPPTLVLNNGAPQGEGAATEAAPGPTY